MQPTYAQSTSRLRRPSLDDMGPGTDRPVPHRASGPRDRLPPREPGADEPSAVPRRPDVDPRTRAGAFGERIRGPHKPTLDEMGPHAMLAVPKGKPPPRKPQPPSARPGGETAPLAPSAPLPPTGQSPELARFRPPPPSGEGPGVGGTPTSPASSKPSRTVEIPGEGEKRSRRGRPRKTGRPGA